MINDLLSDMVARILNAIKAKKLSVEILNSIFCQKILFCIYKLGYIRGFFVKNKKKIIIYLKYIQNKSIIRFIKRISKPGNRKFLNIKNYLKFKNLKIKKLNGFFILSTNKGILTDNEIFLKNVGGEILFYIN